MFVILNAMTRVGRTTAVFASVPGGAAEMSVLGERYGARADVVAAEDVAAMAEAAGSTRWAEVNTRWPGSIPARRPSSRKATGRRRRDSTTSPPAR